MNTVRGMKKGMRYVEAGDHLNLYTMKPIEVVRPRNDFKEEDFIHLRPIKYLRQQESLSGNN